ncbi:hypothetical protein NS303_21730 [Pantoea ananatis]|uniref:hypothetical protein n=1 Tax=Pantoea TaxID=53335 RepID=UPI00048B08E3|nr:hypothetical protein [Pantoea ananatis]KTR45546.1 hypothetical protein NS303_21730 [Pantoea ananatis]KTR54172.1 hypothetical protein NS311_17120 [Pantoea ananatis]KTR62533.1 hypothetical protein RSA47_20970 [Pantoea ananatis]KTR68095.1 hypothetical protein NS296_19970 [Pantoea ananatis]MCW0314783.1 hypothetical protein [Pantoea ananatis]
MGLFFAPTLVELAIKSIYDLYKNSSGGSIVTPEEKAETVDAANSIVDIQAKAQQELAIARRILIAESVEITEIYEASGQGNAGIRKDDTALQVGAHGEGRKMTQRTIKFAGFNHKIEDVIALLDESYSQASNSEDASVVVSPDESEHTPS